MVTASMVEMFIWPAVVDLPTPPLPEATTTTCLTPCIDFLLGSPRAMRSFWCSSNDGLFSLVPLRIQKQKTQSFNYSEFHSYSCPHFLENIQISPPPP